MAHIFRLVGLPIPSGGGTLRIGVEPCELREQAVCSRVGYSGRGGSEALVRFEQETEDGRGLTTLGS